MLRECQVERIRRLVEESCQKVDFILHAPPDSLGLSQN
jgi:hypothetical protein